MNPGLYDMNDNQLCDWYTLVNKLGFNVEHDWYDKSRGDWTNEYYIDLNPGGILDKKFSDMDLKLVIGSDVSKITNGSFKYCENLASIYISDTVKVIEDGAFSFCPNLREVVIPYGVEKISDDIFYCSKDVVIFHKYKRYTYKDLEEYGEFY